MSDLVEKLRELIKPLVEEEVEKRLRATQRPVSYLTTSQAAELAVVTPGTIRRWMDEGRLSKCGVGKDVRVDRGELEALMRPGKRLPRRKQGAKKPKVQTPEAIAFQMLGLTP